MIRFLVIVTTIELYFVNTKTISYLDLYLLLPVLAIY